MTEVSCSWMGTVFVRAPAILSREDGDVSIDNRAISQLLAGKKVGIRSFSFVELPQDGV